MSHLIEPVPVRLFISIIYKKKSHIEECISELIKNFGEVTYQSRKRRFDSTNYYENEMGKNLYRKVISFKELINRDKIVESKIFTCQLEEKYSNKEKRTINLDPGYIAPEHLILATGKGYYHRPYLGKGVYADLTLVYQENKYITLDWTYPDYKLDYMMEIFTKLRKDYLDQLRNRDRL